MMEFKEALQRLEDSDIFKSWKKDNPKTYLSHGFIMFDPAIKEEWQLGYYDPSDDRMTSFIVSEGIEKNPESEVFKKEKKVDELNKEKVKISMQDALSKAKDIQKEKYSAHPILKRIIIVQDLGEGPIWNITFFTSTFRTLNVKLDASTGKVVSDELMDFFRFDK